ncbi:hypothetical protein DYU11_03445 [Fibrisoma montanum]|uniref:Uncharacterized protein n=2 Tax=Fibrisoma montanum TaxID=2305895 RepID=A0A418MIY3_9BACT|nr:hypothetical protein DYU11_03445 [Fibrisoma montanum]
MLRTDDDLLMSLSPQFRQYGKGSKEDPFSRVAHNIRNRHSNPRNNLARRLRRLLKTPGLFPSAEVIRLTDEQRAELDHWKGTPYEVRF